MESLLLKNILHEQLASILNEHISENELPRIDCGLEDSLTRQEITVVTGVRRCGKSTLTQQLIRKNHTNWNVHYINFEEQKLRNFAFDDFEVAYNNFMRQTDTSKKYLLIYDEIQNIDGWEKWVSSFTSATSSINKRTKVIITGSNARLLSTELSTLLTGRHEKIEISPLSFKEVVQQSFQHIKSEDTLSAQDSLELQKQYLEYLQYGGFPKAYTSKSTKLLGQYYEDITLKDIAVRKKIRNISALQSLSTLLTSQNTRLFNKSKIALELGIKDTTTLSKFCSYFIETYLFSEIRCYARSRRQQLRSLSKFFCVDPIMAKEVGYHDTTSSYWILENLVFNVLKKRYREIWYWHSKEGFEVDFVAKEKDGELHAYQVASSIKNQETRERELRALSSAIKEIKATKCSIITEFEHEEIRNSDRVINVIPFYLWSLDG
jgi:predicted AAA+ superfamily ATPase